MVLKRQPSSTKTNTAYPGILPTIPFSLPLEQTKEHRWIRVHFQKKKTEK